MNMHPGWHRTQRKNEIKRIRFFARATTLVLVLAVAAAPGEACIPGRTMGDFGFAVNSATLGLLGPVPRAARSWHESDH